MKTYDMLELAERNLRQSQLRNGLTTLGISVGIASLVNPRSAAQSITLRLLTAPAHCKALLRRSWAMRQSSTDRVVDVTPTLDCFDVAVHRVEVRAHRHDRYVAPPSFAPRRNIARPLVVPATVLLDGLEAECIGRGHDRRSQYGRNPGLPPPGQAP